MPIAVMIIISGVNQGNLRARSAAKVTFSLAVALIAAMLPFVSAQSAEDRPFGVYLWFPDSDGPRTDADCEALAMRLKPSVKQAEDWLSGAAGDFDPETGPYYLIVANGRIDTTFFGEGDYDTGNASFGHTVNGLTPFTLVPDDHPAVTITGSILAPAGSQIVTLSLKDLPQEEGARDRIVRYCRFVDGEVT